MNDFWKNKLEAMMSRISGRVIMHADMTAILKFIYGSRYWDSIYQRSLVVLDLGVKHLYESFVPQRKGDSFTKDGNHKNAVASSNKRFTESPTHI